MSVSLEIHVPICPKLNFFNRIHYLAASLKHAGGLAAESSLIVTVGEDQEPVDLASALPWSRKYPITWRWLDRDLYRRHIYYATALDRFQVDFAAPMVMMLDADTLVVNDFADLVRRIEREAAFCGAIAHLSPFRPFASQPVAPEPAIDQRSSEQWWQAIFDRAALGTVPLHCEHTGWDLLPPFAPHRYCPPYFNLGVLLAPAEVFARLGRTIYQEMAIVDSMMSTPFRCQIALTLSLIRARARCSLMPLRYNFPNYVQMAAAYPEELRDIRIIHYINQDFFKKDQTLDSIENVGAWLATAANLPSVQQILKSRIAELHPAVMEDRLSLDPRESAA